MHNDRYGVAFRMDKRVVYIFKGQSVFDLPYDI